jgi:hypothetical protein
LDPYHTWYTAAANGVTNLGSYTGQTQSTVQFVSYGIQGTSQQPKPDQETIARWAREAEERQIKVTAAASRAEELLFMFIGEERKKQYAEFGHFDVPVNSKVYRIRKGRSNNVLLLENGKPTMKLCAHPSDAVPDGDTMLAQFLMLTSNEKRFLEIANKTPLELDRLTLELAA